MPELKVITRCPEVVERVPLPKKDTQVLWRLVATYPAPLGTVYLRYSSKDMLEIITPFGKLLQRLDMSADSLQATPQEPTATYLPATPARAAVAQAPLLSFFNDGKLLYHFAFPDGFSGFCAISLQDKEDATAVPSTWNGLRFVEKTARNNPDVLRGTVPIVFSTIQKGEVKCFASAIFDKCYLFRWVKAGKRIHLQILTPKGALLATHPLADDFTTELGTDFTAKWLNKTRKTGPILIARTSDSIRVHVFTQGLTRLICAQDFSDFSTSLSATSANTEYDKKGFLVVTENYSEQGDEEGNPSSNNHTTMYVWNGKKFVEK
jgi:hypothetical protein